MEDVSIIGAWRQVQTGQQQQQQQQQITNE